MGMQENLPQWLAPRQVIKLVEEHGSPLYVYSKSTLEKQAEEALKIRMPYGLTIRFVMKANPHAEILKLFKEQGLQIDASSGYEAERAIDAGFEPSDILITAQQLPENLKDLLESGVQFTATSLHQLKTFCHLFPGKDVSVRVNPAMGDGINNRLTTGEVNASFGIWHEYLDEVKRIASESSCKITRLHTHIGTGTDPEKWAKAAEVSLQLVEHLPDVTNLDLGGGFKVAYMRGENSADMGEIGNKLADSLNDFAAKTGRKLHLEIEPGRFLVASAGVLISKVIDKTDTGKQGHTFLRIDTGMNDLLRPGMYGAQHPIVTIKQTGEIPAGSEAVVVAGHNCESTDVLTPYPNDPERLKPRLMGKADIGDYLVIGMAGAYSASMAAHGYNSYPSAKEILL
jgi:diaminopimelate decarboxylase